MCLFLNSVTKLIGSSPAFSANVYGINSSDSPYCLTQYESVPNISREYACSFYDTSISTEAPPGTKNLFLTRALTTQSASWRDLSASSRTS